MDLDSPCGITIKLNDLFKSQVKPCSQEQMIQSPEAHSTEEGKKLIQRYTCWHK